MSTDKKLWRNRKARKELARRLPRSGPVLVWGALRPALRRPAAPDGFAAT